MTCHINFWPLSNFVGASLEVTRTISNNKLHFTWGCSILLLKKRKRALRPDSFDHSDIFLNILIVIITSLAIHHSQNVFSWLFYLGVHRGTGVFFVVLFFTPPLGRDSLSRSPCPCLRLTEKRWKIAPVLQIQASSMKLRVLVFFFLVFFHIKTDGKNRMFFYNHINIQIRRFFSELDESKSCAKCCLIIIRIGTNTALVVFSLGM